jgi:hypothetical protein
MPVAGPANPDPAGVAGLRAAELLARFQREAEARDARRALAEASGIRDEELLERLRTLGITAQTLPALEFVPAILVGWAEGAMSRLERDRLRALAALRGIGDGHPAWPVLRHWMLERPSELDAQVLLAGLFERLDRLPVRHRLRRRRAILRDCEAVARASGRLLGGPKVSREERAALQAVAARLAAS